MELFKGTDKERELARQIQEAADLTAAMLEPKADISAKAGKMERESPLFYGTGENPTFWSEQ